MALQKLPVGIQTFSEIRGENYIYIDKTDIAYNLLDNYKYVFLSRPRRFGKSLFLDTLRNIFQAKKEYFGGLAIEDKWDWSVSYPVIYVNFSQGKIESRKELDRKIISILEDNQEILGIECKDTDSVSICFADLIKKAHQKYNQRVVVLIDEYDKPILDNIEDPTIATQIRDGLINFYSVIKGSDEHLRFAFLTGVSKFTKTSIFSGLNNIEDISLNPDFGDICGYTQNDVETTFAPYFNNAVDMQKLQKWYNGYNFLGSSMYNPYDLLNFIRNNFAYKNYWFESGTPTFLMKLIKKQNYFLPNLSNLVIDEKLLNSFDIENLDLEVILYQTGYLTIDRVVEKRRGGYEYHLKIPNKEVKQSFCDVVIDLLTEQKTQKITFQDRVYDALEHKDLEAFKASLISIYASIPYNNFTKNDIAMYEGFYASVLYVYLQSLGLDIIGEDVTNKGRIDLTIKMDHSIFILEFKVDGTDALTQIKNKRYHQKYQNQNKDIYLIGIEFDSVKRNVVKVEWERSH
jgi:predicted CopG family antitoxin